MLYLDFDIEISSSTGGQSYPVVVRSAAGDTRREMRFPYSELALKDKLKDLRIALLQSSQTHRALTDEEKAVQEFGQQLFEALFAGVVGNLFHASRSNATQEGLLGVRLRLHIQTPDLAGLPWEYLYDPSQEEFLCLSHETSVVRYPELAQPLQPLQVAPPLRILGMIASPSDQDRLDIKREKARMEEALKPLQSSGQMELSWLSGQTWEDLQAALWHGPWHIFHFIGHGGYDKRADEGLIAFCDQEGQTRLLGARDLARLLTSHRALRMVVLNACDGAKGGQRDIFSSTAATLAKRGIPAVLAMQEEITDEAAIQLTRTFYRALANGQPVDAAVDDARTAMSVARRHSLEWGIPVLFLRAPDSTLFSLSGMPTLPPVRPPETPPVLPPEPDESVRRGEQLNKPPRIFYSYSHQDASAVQALRIVYRALGYEELNDIEALRDGEVLSEEIKRMINQADVFQLFWSANAAKSEYVRQEWEYALKLSKGEGFIRPIYWGQPMVPPPAQLAHLHFAYSTLTILDAPTKLPTGDSDDKQGQAAQLPPHSQPKPKSTGWRRAKSIAPLGAFRGRWSASSRRSTSTLALGWLIPAKDRYWLR